MTQIIETTVDGIAVTGVITERFPNRIVVEITAPHQDLSLLREWNGYYFFESPDYRGPEGEEVAFELLEALYRTCQTLEDERPRLVHRYGELRRAIDDVWMSAPTFDEEAYRRRLAELQQRRATGWAEALKLHAEKQELRALRDNFFNGQKERIEQMKETFFHLHLPDVKEPALRDQVLRCLERWAEHS